MNTVKYMTVIGLAALIIVGGQIVWAQVSEQPKPAQSAQALAAEAEVAINKLMERIREEHGEAGRDARHRDFGRINRSRQDAGEAMVGLLQRWKERLVESAKAPISAPLDNQQKIALSVLSAMAPDGAEAEMLVEKIGTKSPYFVAISDNPLEEYPYASALCRRPVSEELFDRYSRVSPEKIRDKEIDLAAEVLCRWHGRDLGRAPQVLALLNFEKEQPNDFGYLKPNVERLETSWKKISHWKEPASQLEKK